MEWFSKNSHCIKFEEILEATSEISYGSDDDFNLNGYDMLCYNNLNESEH